MRRFVVLGGAVFVVEAALFSSLAALLPHYEDELGISSVATGVLAGSYAAGMILGTVLAGLWVTDRIGVRATAVGGGLLLAVSTVAFGLGDTIALLDAARFVQGIGAGLLWSAMLNWLIQVSSPEARGESIGAAIGAAVFGTAVGPLLGAATGLVGEFPVFAALAAVIGGLTLALAVLPGLPLPAPSAAVAGRRNFALPADRVLRGLTAVSCAIGVLGGALIALGPLRLSDVGLGDTAVAMVLLAASLVAAAACPYAGRLADRRGARLPLVIGLSLAAISIVALGSLDSPSGAALSFVLFQGIALSIAWIPAMSLFTRRAEGLGMDTAAVATVLNLTLAFGYAFGPPLATALAAVETAVGYSILAAIALALLAAGVRWRGFGAVSYSPIIEVR